VCGYGTFILFARGITPFPCVEIISSLRRKEGSKRGRGRERRMKIGNRKVNVKYVFLNGSRYE
jgi:hypothetical protein